MMHYIFLSPNIRELQEFNPKTFNVALEDGVKNHIDLQVSGHTHKGQFFTNNLITSRIFEVDYGYLKKNDMNVVVSSGYGTWGPPIRLGSRSEIVNLRIKLNK